MRRLWMMMALAGLIGGCSSTPREDATSKREQDRVAMKLADAERERDELRGQIKTMASTTEQALAAQRVAEGKVARLEQESAALRAGASSADQLKTELAAANAKLADNTGRIKELTTQVEALKTELAKQASATTKPTAPEMNK